MFLIHISHNFCISSQMTRLIFIISTEGHTEVYKLNFFFVSVSTKIPDFSLHSKFCVCFILMSFLLILAYKMIKWNGNIRHYWKIEINKRWIYTYTIEMRDFKRHEIKKNIFFYFALERICDLFAINFYLNVTCLS